MPRIVVIPSPMFDNKVVREVGEILEPHIDVVLTVDDEWRVLFASSSSDDSDLVLKMKMTILDAVSGCKTGIGNVCPAVVLHRNDIGLLWLVDDGTVRFLSIKEMLRRKEILYAYSLESQDDLKLFRLQTYKPMEHRRFFEDQFENLELEVYEMLYGSRDLGRWMRLTRVATLPAIARTVAEATRRFVAELCIFGDYNVCPGVLLVQHEDRVDVKILKITSRAENYMARIDLADLLASNR